MGCCDLKRGTGKCLVFFFTIAFNIGVIVSCSAPSWISFTATTSDDASSSLEVYYGPFYSQSRTCADDGQCSEWILNSIDLSDCESIEDSDDLATLCTRLNTWRSLAIVCLILVVLGGGLVFMGSCCQAATCGCCGNSLDCIANVLFWTEVVLSVVVWSFAISSVNLIATGESVVQTGYEWAFWVFLVFGSIVGGIAAAMADWAAEDSFLRGIWRLLTCHSCRKRDDD